MDTKLSRGAALDFIDRQFGGNFDVGQGVVTVGTGKTTVVSGDAERVTLTIVNLGAADVYVAPDERVTTTRGIRLASGGGFVTYNVLEDAILPTLPWVGTSSGAGNAVFYIYAYRYQRPYTEGSTP